MNLNNYTQKSLESVQSARDLAVQNGHQQLEQVHLLLALLLQDGGLVIHFPVPSWQLPVLNWYTLSNSM